MNKPITVNELKKMCEEQIKNGNGDSVIMISSDDEGNSYHYLWYDFIEAKEMIDNYNILEFDKGIADIKNTIILG